MKRGVTLLELVIVIAILGVAFGSICKFYYTYNKINVRVIENSMAVRYAEAFEYFVFKNVINEKIGKWYPIENQDKSIVFSTKNDISNAIVSVSKKADEYSYDVNIFIDNKFYLNFPMFIK